jgi:hypothetical protein
MTVSRALGTSIVSRIPSLWTIIVDGLVRMPLGAIVTALAVEMKLMGKSDTEIVQAHLTDTSFPVFHCDSGKANELGVSRVDVCRYCGYVIVRPFSIESKYCRKSTSETIREINTRFTNISDFYTSNEVLDLVGSHIAYHAYDLVHGGSPHDGYPK